MTLDTLLNVALDVAFLGVFGLALADYMLHRERIRLAIVAVVGSVAIVFAVQVLRALVPAIPPALGIVAIVSLLAQPVLTLWLTHQFGAVSRRLVLVALALYVVSTILLVTNIAPAIARLIAVGYFVGVDTLAAVLLAREARRRAGASRSRLALAAVATALLGAAVLVAAAGALVQDESANPAFNIAGRIVALFAALAYLVAFTPPAFLRRISHQATTLEFIRELAALPTGTPPTTYWDLLARQAIAVTGASGASVVTWAVGSAPDGRMVVGSAGEPRGSETSETGASSRRVLVPILGDDGPIVTLELRLPGLPLFMDDDIELLTLLGSRTARAVDRETLINDLLRASAAKSDFLAAMSHELRTPLNAIIGFSELLVRPDEGGNDPATVIEYAEHIHGSGLHLLELINDVLDLAKVEAGRIDLRVARVDVRGLVGQTLDTMRPLAERRAIELRGPEAGVVEVEADAGRLRQIVFNLVSNAVKFTPEQGRVSVDVARTGDEVELVVEDTGPGIPRADQEVIFEAFRQLHTGDAARQHGTGLGLALTRQLVEAHGGRIELDSEVGRGSRFRVVLPAAGPLPAAELPEPIGEPSAPLVLVVEDDPRAAELVRVYLGDAGFRVARAADGRSGFELATQLRPAAIMLDILLPDIDGWELLQRLKQSDATRDIPVIVVSVVDDSRLGFALGAVDYFVKPVARDALLTALGRLTFTTKVRERRVSVLVIDADQTAGELYRSILPDGFDVAVAATAADGLDRARRERPDIVLLDLLLPDLDGYEVVTRLKADELTQDIPIWVSTRRDLGPDDKARLNGKVLGIIQPGDGGIAGLHDWLGRVAVSERAG